MAEYTANYGLHQWEPGDSFLRTDFNEDFAKIDGVIAEKPYVVGRVASMAHTTVFEVGFPPSAGFLMNGEVFGFFDGEGGWYRAEYGEDSSFTVVRHDTGVTLTAGKVAFATKYPVGYLFFK